MSALWLVYGSFSLRSQLPWWMMVCFGSYQNLLKIFLQRSPLRLRSLYEIAPPPSPFIQPPKRPLKHKKAPFLRLFCFEKILFCLKSGLFELFLFLKANIKILTPQAFPVSHNGKPTACQQDLGWQKRSAQRRTLLDLPLHGHTGAGITDRHSALSHNTPTLSVVLFN